MSEVVVDASVVVKWFVQEEWRKEAYYSGMTM